jgi:hypothetical protein
LQGKSELTTGRRLQAVVCFIKSAMRWGNDFDLAFGSAVLFNTVRPMPLPEDEDFWEDLIVHIKNGRVIPVVGERAICYGDDNSFLYGWLAHKLIEKLKVPAAGLPAGPSLNQVICRYLLDGGEPNLIYTRLNRILENECPAPGSNLLRLASIVGFNLYITTTFDSLLERALNQARYGGKPLTQIAAYCPAKAEDIPARKNDLPRATLYHIFGRVSPSATEYVAQDEDVLDFMCSLQSHLSGMPNLASDLKEHALLVLGLNFSDWLTRFFLRITMQNRLSERKQIEYIAEDPPAAASETMVMFFGKIIKNIKVVECEPIEFISELHRRWSAKYPATAESTKGFVPPPAHVMPTGAIFLSYAREDEESAVRLKAGLERFGCDVWYDRERLKPGVNWRNELEDEVKERCALFISVISKTTEDASEAYFHRERKWAADRQEGIANEEFYIPVVIDDSPLATRREPPVFRNMQATRLRGGEVTPDFGEHMRLLQEKTRSRLGTP